MIPEFRKMLVHRAGLLLIIAAACLKIITMLLRHDFTLIDQNAETNKEQFLAYMQTLAGALTPEKEAYIANEEQFFLDAADAWQRADSDYTAGRLSELNWIDALEQYETAQLREEAFASVRTQYAAAQQDSRCCFLYANGWAVLLAQNSPDWVLLLLIALLTAPVLCAEYACGMDSLLDTALHGGRRLRRRKLAAVLVTAVCITLLFFALEVGFIIRKYGLPGANSPLQSVPQMRSSEWQITILQAAGMTLLHRILGACFFALAVFSFSAWTKQPVPAMLGGLCTVLLPYVIFSDSVLLWRLPLPCGMLCSAGYLCSAWTVPGSDEVIHVTQTDWRFALIGYLVVMGVLTVLCINAVSPRKKLKLAVLFPLFLLLTGCSSVVQNVRYNSVYGASENAEYRVIWADSGLPMLLPQNGGETICLDRNPFSETYDTVYDDVFMSDNAVYRLENRSDGMLLETVIIRTDIPSFAEAVVYREIQQSIGSPTMFGLDNLISVDMRSSQPRRILVVGNDILMQCADGIYIARIGGRSRKLLISARIVSWCFAESVIWYTDRQYRVHRYDLVEQRDDVPDIGRGSQIVLEGDSVRFLQPE